MWLLCGCCAAAVWLLCGCCVAAVRLLCGYCVAAALHIEDNYVAKITSMSKSLPIVSEQKRSFANMWSVSITPPSPPNSMLGTLARHDLYEKERFFRIGPTAAMEQH